MLLTVCLYSIIANEGYLSVFSEDVNKKNSGGVGDDDEMLRCQIFCFAE